MSHESKTSARDKFVLTSRVRDRVTDRVSVGESVQVLVLGMGGSKVGVTLRRV